jgi:hypothetical protein
MLVVDGLGLEVDDLLGCRWFLLVVDCLGLFVDGYLLVINCLGKDIEGLGWL